jgi:1,5-anhydro-D-fructose reductase (1,5-anhydro-D-mannitol-forming)
VGSSLEKSEAYAAKHGGRAFAGFDELLADGAIEIVYIATPNALHAEQVIAAAAAGKQIFCDKPLATSVAEAEKAVDACNNAGVALGINFQTRHHQGMSEIRDALAAGEIGAPLIVQCEVSAGRGELRGWRRDPGLAGLGAMNNIGVHAYDVLRFLLGAEIVEATVLTDATDDQPLELAALALFRFDNGTLAYVNANQTTPRFEPDLTIHGTEGRISGRSVTRPNLEGGEFTILRGDDERRIPAPTTDAFVRTVAAYELAIERGETPNASGVDGLRSVQLTDALARSAREKRTVIIDY